MESGTVQFNDDWPGVFIRGDNAAGAAMSLAMVLSEAAKCEDFRRSINIIDFLQACSYVDILSGSDLDLPEYVQNLKQLAHEEYSKDRG